MKSCISKYYDFVKNTKEIHSKSNEFQKYKKVYEFSNKLNFHPKY